MSEDNSQNSSEDTESSVPLKKETTRVTLKAAEGSAPPPPAPTRVRGGQPGEHGYDGHGWFRPPSPAGQGDPRALWPRAVGPQVLGP